MILGFERFLSRTRGHRKFLPTLALQDRFHNMATARMVAIVFFNDVYPSSCFAIYMGWGIVEGFGKTVRLRHHVVSDKFW